MDHSETNLGIPTISKSALSKMSAEQLRQLQCQAQAIQDQISSSLDSAVAREARLELRRRKATYELRAPKYKSEVVPATALQKLTAYFKAEDMLYRADFDSILQQSSVCRETPKEQVYPCPICGRMSLQLANYGDHYQVHCYEEDDCDFTCPSVGKEKYHAWDNFIVWLHKNGYLGPKKPTLEAVGLEVVTDRAIADPDLI